MFKLSLICSLFFFTACSYQWGNRNESLPGKYSEIAVPVFKNQTQEVGAEIYFTNAIIEELSRNPSSKLTSQEYAEVVLEGEVRSLAVVGEGLATFKDPANCPTVGTANCLPSGTELANTYRMDVIINIRIRRKVDRQVIWSKSLSGQRSFASTKLAAYPGNSANPLYNQSALHINLKLMAEQMMSQAYFSLTETF